MPDRMRRVALLLVCFLVLWVAPSAATAPEEYDKAISTLRCDCGCHPQSLKDCACGYAAKRRDEIRQTMERENLDGDAMIAKYLAENEGGELLRIAPTARGFNLVAWLGPPIALVLIVPVALMILRRWHGPAEAMVADAGGPVAPPADDEYMERLRRDLEERQ
ncbi:MAG: cytochrome c-type biogenesis protein CcmH [bacterium]|nr:cytochrome c-type biogenesis protein CcmH [bacterium]